MKLTWVIQKNLSDGDTENLAMACRIHKSPVLEVSKIEDLVAVAASAPVIIYGGFGLTIPAKSLNRWKPGVLLDGNFDFEIWNKKWGMHCLNCNAPVMTVRHLYESGLPPTATHFIRPCLEGKQFSGAVMSLKEFNDWAFTASMISPESLDARILVTNVREIKEEWRVFMVNGRVSTGSMYQRDGKSVQEELPEDVKTFARRIAYLWCPAPVFTLDICRYAGMLFVVETGCFNSAGLYGANTVDLVGDINSYYASLGDSDKPR